MRLRLWGSVARSVLNRVVLSTDCPEVGAKAMQLPSALRSVRAGGLVVLLVEQSALVVEVVVGGRGLWPRVVLVGIGFSVVW